MKIELENKKERLLSYKNTLTDSKEDKIILEIINKKIKVIEEDLFNLKRNTVRNENIKDKLNETLNILIKIYPNISSNYDKIKFNKITQKVIELRCLHYNDISEYIKKFIDILNDLSELDKDINIYDMIYEFKCNIGVFSNEYVDYGVLILKYYEQDFYSTKVKIIYENNKFTLYDNDNKCIYPKVKKLSIFNKVKDYFIKLLK